MSYTKENSLSGADSTQQTPFNPGNVTVEEARSIFEEAFNLGWKKVQHYLATNPPQLSPEDAEFIAKAKMNG